MFQLSHQVLQIGPSGRRGEVNSKLRHDIQEVEIERLTNLHADQPFMQWETQIDQ